MTRSSALFGGSSSPRLRSGSLYMAHPQGFTTTNWGASIDADYIVPFAPRESCTLDKVAWMRKNTSAGNVYVGLYSAAGSLLTDCAVDADTTSGWHLVNTTNVALVARQLYWLAFNMSADVVCGQGFATYGTIFSGSTNQDYAGYQDLVRDFGFPVDLGTASFNSIGVAQIKSRTNAALLSSLTMSGFGGTESVPVLGVVLA